MRLIKKGQPQELSKLFHFNLRINMPTLVDEYEFIYGKGAILDKTMKINCYMSPIIMSLNNSNFNLLMKCLFHNITYDDGCDMFMIHDYTIPVDKII